MSSLTRRSAAATWSAWALERDLVAAHQDGDLGELVLDGGEQAILRAEEPDHGHAIHLQFGVGSVTCTDARR